MATSLRRTVAQNIRALARQRGLSLDALADFAGVSRRQLYNFLSERNDVTLGWLAKVARALEVEPSKLLRARVR